MGQDDERPESRTISWVTMMSSPGTRIGLMLYRVAEPLAHLSAPPPGLAKPNSQEAAQLSMQ